MSDKKGLPRPPFYTNEYIDMAEILEFAFDRFGQLILALMYYTTDGTQPNELPDDLHMMFTIQKRKIDYAREKYYEKVVTNSKNGAKGGRPRKNVAVEPEETSATPTVEPPKKAKATPKIKMPPTEEQFTKLLMEEQADGLVSAECNPAEFFEWAESLNWKINGEPAKNAEDFLAYAAAKYPTESVIGSIRLKAPKLSLVYGIIFKKLHGLRDEEGNTGALVAAIDFLKAYDGGWNLHGQSFPDDQWKEALDEFMQGLKTE